MKKQLALEFIYKIKMIATKFIFANLGTLYRLTKSYKANKFLCL
jgi:hypothetical protein